MLNAKLLLFAAYSHQVATVHMLLDRMLPQPLEGTMSPTLWRLKRSRDVNYCHVNGVRQKVTVARFICFTFILYHLLEFYHLSLRFGFCVCCNCLQ